MRIGLKYLCISLAVGFTHCFFDDGIEDGPGGPFENSVSFESAVVGLFTNNCISSGCHSGPSPAGGMNLAADETSVSLVYENVLPRIDPDDPENSLLLLKPSNQVDHPAGVIFPTTSLEFRTILQWIEEGAFNDDCAGISHSFSANVVPIFTQCDGLACHDAVPPILSASPFLSIQETDSVDLADPVQSPLLRKPLGLDQHGGGTIFAQNTNNDYRTIFCWIKEDDAANN